MLKQLATKIIKKKVGTPAELIAGVVLAGATVIGISEHEKDHPEYANYEIDSKGKVSRDMRFVFLTDLHEKEFGAGNQRLIKMIDDAHPDFILIGGDMIIGYKNNEKHDHKTSVTLELCEQLAKKYPVYYGNGNHELRINRKVFREILEEDGIIYLDNETAVYEDCVSISGINLESGQYAPVVPTAPVPEELKSKIGKVDDQTFKILLAHSPLFLETYEQTGADLVLSGHFHGGTIRIGGNVGIMTPQYQFFSTKVVGLSQKDGCFMIISSGLGTHSINIRINDRPQVVVVDIKK